MKCRQELAFSSGQLNVIVGEANAISETPLQKADLTGCSIWDASLLLALVLDVDFASSSYFKDKTVLELGAGCGVVGMVAARSGARLTVLTDCCAEALQQMSETIEENSLMSCEVANLNWNEECSTFALPMNSVVADNCAGAGVPRQSGYDVLLLSDSLYTDAEMRSPSKDWRLLLATMEHLSHDSTELFVCSVRRRQDGLDSVERFLELAECSWDIEKIALDISLHDKWPVDRELSEISVRATPWGTVFYTNDAEQLEVFRLRHKAK